MYTAIYTNKKTDEQRRIIIEADNIRAARRIANDTEYIQPNEYVKVLCDLSTGEGIQEASIEIVKRTTANMISREGGEIQYRLYNGIRQLHPNDADVLDCIQTVSLSLLESYQNNIDVETAYIAAYRKLYNYLYSCRAVKETIQSMRTTYIEDIDGDIVNVNKSINTIIKASQPLPTIEEDDEEETTAIAGLLIDLMKDFTPTQKRVIKYIADGYSERQIAEKMNRSQQVIHRHKTTAIKKALEKYPNGIEDIKSFI